MNILYGVPGEGMGHATRSKVVIEHLLERGHDVLVVSSASAFQFLNKEFPGKVIEIKGFHFAYRNAEISTAKTFLSNLKLAGKNLIYNTGKKILIEKSFRPDLVISDFESFTFFFAKEHRLPLVSIDNMQVMDRCVLDLEIPKEEKNNYALAKNIVKSKVPGCDHYFISSFFDVEVKKKNTEVVPADNTNGYSEYQDLSGKTHRDVPDLEQLKNGKTHPVAIAQRNFFRLRDE